MAVPTRLGLQIAKLKRISSRQNEQILQLTIARWMKSGGFEKHLRKMRRIYEERKNAMIQDLQHFKKTHPEIHWIEPDGGMALWLDMGIETTEFSERLRKKSILLNAEKAFRLDGNSGTHLRLGFSGYTKEENRASLEALFNLRKMR